MIRAVYMIYALALLLSYGMLFGARPDGLIPAGIILGLWAFVFYSDYRPRTLGIVAIMLVLGCCCFSLIMPLQTSGHGNARRWSQCKNNLKQIGIALHNYHEIYGAFPPAYIADETGKPMHSWRVLLLPQFDQPDLYVAYNFNKPWDSPENLELVKRMPETLACPSHHAFGEEKTTTSYVAVLGPRTTWPGSGSTKFSDMKDGPSNIVMVIEHHSDIPWTEPRDLTLEEATTALATTAIEPFGGHRSESFFYEHFFGRWVLVGDGSGTSAPFGLDQTLTRELLTIDDGKPAVGWDLENAGTVAPQRLRWGNVILFWTCVILTLLPLPWVWIHPQGIKTQATTDHTPSEPPGNP